MSEPKHSTECESTEQALHWFTRLTENDLSRTERREYLAWMRANEEHVEALVHIYRCHAHARELKWLKQVSESRRIDRSSRPWIARQKYLSQDFALDLRRRHRIPMMVLTAVATVAIALAVGTLDWQYLAVGVTLLLFSGLIRVKDHIVARRVSSGRFGTNESEARDLIGFMLQRAAHDDFNDEGGRPRRALAPEVRVDALRTSVSGAEVLSK